eukprot:CAMPEP_0171561948 /NCGR_PEP_ID=MMETSP0960-20121227/14685_1 /TAXON_ID=87120 /ORGANISM="Aurantiochytrium limacinum, Strain ATCCMYA-1381" /LENGTH=59 /DNA_ID=CAMNT_0012114615 /DNA_START=132 /DNA_END=311 /DNA_ORIENTATION=+
MCECLEVESAGPRPGRAGRCVTWEPLGPPCVQPRPSRRAAAAAAAAPLLRLLPPPPLSA